MDGLELQARLAEAVPDLTVIIMTAYASVETAVKALKDGAYDYIVKPFDPDELSHLVAARAEHRSLRSENVRLKQSLEARRAAAARRRLAGDAARAGADRDRGADGRDRARSRASRAPARSWWPAAIHAGSPRRYNPMVIVNCGALAEGVLESELFGHEKGAFTGAQLPPQGQVRAGGRRHLFLDEIGEISPQVQVELLRVLEEKRVTRVGRQRSRSPWTSASSRRRTATCEAAGARTATFREDLFYRLNVVTIEHPAAARAARGRPAARRALPRALRAVR